MAAFDTIIGEQLSSVIFVQDYLQLDFDGNMMNFYSWPILKKRTMEMQFPHQDYRNFLCEFIAKLVAKVNYIEDFLFEIVFEDGSTISLDFDNAVGEMLFVTFNDGKWGTIAKMKPTYKNNKN